MGVRSYLVCITEREDHFHATAVEVRNDEVAGLQAMSDLSVATDHNAWDAGKDALACQPMDGTPE